MNTNISNDRVLGLWTGDTSLYLFIPPTAVPSEAQAQYNRTHCFDTFLYLQQFGTVLPIPIVPDYISYQEIKVKKIFVLKLSSFSTTHFTTV